ncbi:MAG: uracil-DNA glycosylase family protein [Burkholderiales bacterium]
MNQSVRDKKLELLLREVRGCTLCREYLPLRPRPILRASTSARILVVGQAPGRKVHQTGIPWNDPSGDLLREWMGVSKEIFYDETRIAIIPTGFCYPGKGPQGDLPPRPECAPLWHPQLAALMPQIELVVLVGQYAQAVILRDSRKPTLTATVLNYADYAPRYFPLPHPSPRNRMWLKRNPWFARDIIPRLREKIGALI